MYAMPLYLQIPRCMIWHSMEHYCLTGKNICGIDVPLYILGDPAYPALTSMVNESLSRTSANE